MNKICLVVQRYGIEVNGGAELQCRQFAEHLCDHYLVEVATTKAVDYITWKDEYTQDTENINGVVVHRFSVEKERDLKRFNEINGRFINGLMEESEEQKWIDEQGPLVPELIEFIKNNQDEYVAFLFFTYLYYPTVMGVKQVADKAIVIPEAHDEPFLKMRIFDDVFLKPRAFFFNTEEERTLVHQKYHNEYIPSDIGGAGIDIEENVSGDRFKNKYNLSHYIVYVGRIDEGKNCDELFKYFLEYKKRNHNDIKLVLMGKPVIPVPKDKDIVSLGFVSDQDKFDGIAGAEILVLPSEFESLSLVVLEAMSLRTPVIVNGKCAVLRGHCVKSNGAFYYNNYFEFEGEINYILSHTDVVEVMGNNAEEYVNDNYRWKSVMARLEKMIEKIAE